MLLALGVSAVVALALLSDIAIPRIVELWRRYRVRRRPVEVDWLQDPGRERRAEQRARELLRSCVSEEEWSMYRELGFIRVWGRQPRTAADGPERAYLVYPHRPVVAYAVQTGRILREYCVGFPDGDRLDPSSRLPDSDDVLAKWMALTSDEGRLLDSANMHLPGRQVDVDQVTRDLWRLSRWERARMHAEAAALGVHLGDRDSSRG